MHNCAATLPPFFLKKGKALLKCDLFKWVFMHQSYLTFAKTNVSPFGEIFYDKNTIDLTADSLGKRYCSWQ